MSITFVTQTSGLSVFTPVDRETGEALPTQTWSDRLWTTEFAEGLVLAGLTLSWAACTIYHHGVAYAIPAGAYTFTADPAYSTSIVIWLDPASPDKLTADVVVLDGAHALPEPAPISGDDIVRLAWGTIPAGGTEINLNVLRHVREV